MRYFKKEKFELDYVPTQIKNKAVEISKKYKDISLKDVTLRYDGLTFTGDDLELWFTFCHKNEPQITFITLVNLGEQ